MLYQKLEIEWEELKGVLQKLLINIFLFSLISCQSPISYLKKRTYVECEFLGISPYPSKSYPKYVQFRDETEIGRLRELSESENLTIRTYAYWALIEKLQKDYLEVFDLILQDTSQIGQRCGCTGESEIISTSVYFNYFEKQLNRDSSVGESRVSKSEKLYRIDSMILNHKLKNEELIEIVLENRIYEGDQIVNRILELAFKEDNVDAAEYVKRNLNSESIIRNKSKILKMNSEKLSKLGQQLLEDIKNVMN